MYDFPIVYASETFERLTGYTGPEIIGRNCRFLQSPDGQVTAGSRRRFTDNDAVLRLKNGVLECRDAQAWLLNYKKGGIPFMNLITMVPITLVDGGDIIYFFGFQAVLLKTYC